MELRSRQCAGRQQEKDEIATDQENQCEECLEVDGDSAGGFESSSVLLVVVVVVVVVGTEEVSSEPYAADRLETIEYCYRLLLLIHSSNHLFVSILLLRPMP